MDAREMEDTIEKMQTAIHDVHKSSLRFAKHVHEQMSKSNKPIPKFLQDLMDEASITLEKEDGDTNKKP